MGKMNSTNYLKNSDLKLDFSKPEGEKSSSDPYTQEFSAFGKLFSADPPPPAKELKDRSITAQDSSQKSTSPFSKGGRSAFTQMPRLDLKNMAKTCTKLKVEDYEEEDLSNNSCQRSYKESKDT